MPIPPLKPWQIIPVPLPTLPSATGPAAAVASAWSTCSGLTCRPLMSLRIPSQVSPTTGSAQNGSGGRSRAIAATIAPCTVPTSCVFVSATGVVKRPDSRIHAVPVSSPFPFSRCQPANTGSSHTRPSCGTTTVTPVRTGPCADTKRPVALDQRGVPDADARHVGDRVGRAGLVGADRDPEVASAHARDPSRCSVALQRAPTTTG